MKIPDLIAEEGRHEREISAFFGKNRMNYRRNGPVFDGPLVLLGFTNRTGSTLLANHLRGLDGVSGFQEHLNDKAVQRRSGQAGIKSLPGYFRHGEAGKEDPAHIYGYKAGWNQIRMLLLHGIDRMYGGGIRLLHMTRRDVLAQAISLSIARQTAQWSSRHPGREGVEPVYDGNDISRTIQGCFEAESRIRLLAEMFALPRHEVAYEDLMEDPRTIMRGIGDFLGRDLSAWAPAEVAIRRQASDRNAEWRARYLEDSRAALLEFGKGFGKSGKRGAGSKAAEAEQAGG